MATTPLVTARHLGALSTTPDPQARLQDGIDLMPTLVHGCHHASVTTAGGGRLEVRVASDRTSRRADRLQDELHQGPCLQAFRTGHSVLARDLGTETRWPRWCSAAVDELPVRSVLSVLLVARFPTATLNLYSDTADGLAAVDLALLHTLAEPLAEALLDECAALQVLGPAA